MLQDGRPRLDTFRGRARPRLAGQRLRADQPAHRGRRDPRLQRPRGPRTRGPGHLRLHHPEDRPELLAHGARTAAGSCPGPPTSPWSAATSTCCCWCTPPDNRALRELVLTRLQAIPEVLSTRTLLVFEETDLGPGPGPPGPDARPSRCGAGRSRRARGGAAPGSVRRPVEGQPDDRVGDLLRRRMPPRPSGRYHSTIELIMPKSSRVASRTSTSRAQVPVGGGRLEQLGDPLVELAAPLHGPALGVGVAAHPQQQRHVRQLGHQHLDRAPRDVLQPLDGAPSQRPRLVEDPEEAVQRPADRAAAAAPPCPRTWW